MLLAHFKASSPFPDGSVVDGFEGPKLRGHVEIDGLYRFVTCYVTEQQLAFKGHFPSIGLILNINELNLEHKKAFIGTQIRVTSSDMYVNHMFSEIVLSHSFARKIDKLSNGKFGYSTV